MNLLSIDEAFEFVRNGASIKQDENAKGIPITRIETIWNSSIDNERFGYANINDTSKYKNHLLAAGDILMSHINSPKHLGKCAQYKLEPEKLIHGMNLLNLRPKKSVLSSGYVFYYFNTNIFKQKINKISNQSVNQASFSVGNLKKVKIPLPSLPEQQKIAEILDAADSLRQKDQQLIDHYTELSQSLFLEMFGDPVSNPMGWKMKKLNDVSTSQLGKMLSKKSKQDINPKKYLRNANVRWRCFNLNDVLEMDFNDREVEKFSLSYGDLLVCEGGEVGRCAIWRENIEDCYYQKALHRVRVDSEHLTPEYLQEYFYWMSKLGGLNSSVSEVTFSHLTAEKLKQLKIPLPQIELQNQFSERTEAIEQQKQQAQASLEKSEALFNSLLQRAFKGELTRVRVA